MATYLEWNEAIADFFTRGLMRSEALYLSVDEDTLMAIGSQRFSELDVDEVVHDFESALRKECVRGEQILLPPIAAGSEGGPPHCIAFLAGMVLAAHRMAPEDDIAEINYFTRLREILGVIGESGRPRGLRPPAPEEPLWVAFNDWAIRNEWQPTAERGPEGTMKFTNYPLSQSLLRQGDKGRLEREFRDTVAELGRESDRERIGGWFFNRATAFSTSHIRKLAQESTTDRFDAIVDAVHRVYMSIDWEQSSPDHGMSRRWAGPRRLTAGLYREADPLFGSITYYLFPRRYPGEIQRELSVIRDGECESMHRDKDGQFRPLWPVDPDGGENYEVIGDPRVTELQLPARDFWVLTRDRFDDSSGTYASRGAPRLGETFLLLCRKQCEDQLNILKDEGLLFWDGSAVHVPDHDQWVEYRECMVLSSSWGGIVPQIPGLFDELRPHTRASISLRGGLKAGQRDTWIEGHMPELFITSFDTTWRIRITEVSQLDAKPLFDGVVNSNISIDLSHIGSGDYWVEILENGRSVDRRYMRVLPWGLLEPTVPTQAFGTPVGKFILRGGLLTDRNNTVNQ